MITSPSPKSNLSNDMIQIRGVGELFRMLSLTLEPKVRSKLQVSDSTGRRDGVGADRAHAIYICMLSCACLHHELKHAQKSTYMVY